MQEATTRLGSKLPYREAVDELARMWGVTLSVGTVRTVTDASGQAAQAVRVKQVKQLQKETPEPEQGAAQVTLSADGAMVQLTSGEWAEVKTMVIGEHRQVWQAKQSRIETKIEQISYFAQMASASEFTEQSLAEWHRRGGEKAKEVVSVSDGALWIQELVTYHRPYAVRVIDFSHAVAYLADVGKAVHGEGTAEFKRWFGVARRQLRHNPPRATLGMLYLLRRQYPDESETAVVIDRAVYYLKRREEMIDYPHFRRKGYPIGSGCVESGHKVVMQRRMKQAGMRWSPACVNPMLALRSLICNDRWD